MEQLVGKKFLRKKSYLGEKEKETLFVVEEATLDDFS